MSRSTLRLPLLVALASATTVGGCKRSDPPPEESTENTEPEPAEVEDQPTPIVAEVVEPPPQPLELSATAPIIVHLGDPHAMLEGLRAFVPQLPAPRTLLETVVTAAKGGEIGAAIVSAVDLRRPWTLASAEGELVVRVPVLPRRAPRLSAKLSALPAVGRVGGVDLRRRSSPGPTRAWLDEEQMTLTLAQTDRGLVTGRELAEAYGDRAVRVELDGAEVRTLVPDFRFDSLTISGSGPHDFEATASGVPPELLGHFDVLRPGALTGLLESDGIAMGASSRYRDHEAKVKQLLGTIETEMKISAQPALVRPTLEDLRRRMGRVLGHWNGRTMMGLGPKDHLRVALGAEDPTTMRSETISLLQDVASKLDFVHGLVSGLPLPKVRFQLVKAVGAGLPISVFALENAREHLPPHLTPLIDRKGDLRIAMAFSEPMGAAVLVIGADAHTVLSRWLEDTAKATTAAESTGDVLSATLAVGYEALLPVLQDGVDPFTLLGLAADREPTRAVFTLEGTTVGVTVDGPAPPG